MATASILNSVKKNLGVAEDYEVFDPDILMYINGVFSTVKQLGIGPSQGFIVEDADATWADFLGSGPRWMSVRTYTYLRVKMLFDPPGTSYLIAAMKEQIDQLEYRLNLDRESTDWVSPEPSPPVTDVILDGGSP